MFNFVQVVGTAFGSGIVSAVNLRRVRTVQKCARPFTNVTAG